MNMNRIVYPLYGISKRIPSKLSPLSSNYSKLTSIINNDFIKCRFSSLTQGIAAYEDVKYVSENKKSDILLIDVREPEELKETGKIPNSINIPLGELENALKATNEIFVKNYGTTKPDTNARIIFTCRAGRRSAEAQSISQQFGYKNTKNYLGGWLDWEEKFSASKE